MAPGIVRGPSPVEKGFSVLRSIYCLFMSTVFLAALFFATGVFALLQLQPPPGSAASTSPHHQTVLVTILAFLAAFACVIHALWKQARHIHDLHERLNLAEETLRSVRFRFDV